MNSKVKTIITFIFCILVQAANSYAQSKKNILKPGSNQLIPYTNASLPLVEPHLAVNPQNNEHMVVAAIVFDSAQVSDYRTHIAVFATKDNGRTWKQTDLPMKVGFDPWVAIKDDNEVRIVSMAGYESGYRTKLGYYASHDGGFTWPVGDSIMFSGNHDHPTMAVDPVTERLYILSSVTRRDTARQLHSYAWINFSDDWKQFQASPLLLHVGPVNSNTLTINVDHKGRVILPYVEYAVTNNQAQTPSFKYMYSGNGQDFLTSHITNKAGLAKGFAVTATDTRSKYKGRIYFVKNSGNDPLRSNGLYLQYTDSLGGKWSEDVRIDHNDNKEKFMRTAAVSINKNGVLGVVWVDRRNDTAIKKNDIYFTVSMDGGKTFEKEIKVTDVSSDPATLLNGLAGKRFVSGGDYIGCASKPDGSFQLVWADNRSGIFQLFTSNVKVNNKASK